MTAPTHITDAEPADWIAHVSEMNAGVRCRMTNGVVLRGLRRIAAEAPIVAAARAFVAAQRGADGSIQDAINALMAAVDAADAEVTR